MDKAWYEVGNWSLDTNMSPKLDKALTDFTSRIDDEMFQRFGQEFICIVDCAIGQHHPPPGCGLRTSHQEEIPPPSLHHGLPA